MTEKRVQFSNIVKNQLPDYIKQEFPLISEFLSQYYISQEFQSAPVDLIQNIDRYVSLESVTSNYDQLTLLGDIDDISTTINIDLSSNLEGTEGFPDSYGLIQIDNEIITYTSKTESSFLGCVRGFSGVTSYHNEVSTDQLVFNESLADSHESGSKIINLTSLFLKEFLKKIKYHLTPGFEDREFASDINKRVFISHSKDFYKSKGTDESFSILFRSLYGKEVKVIKPREYLFRPSDAQFISENVIVVESIEGDPFLLENQTLYQDEYNDIKKAYAPISKIQKIYSGSNIGVGKSYYRLTIDSGYNRDINVFGSTFGEFSAHPQTKSIEVLSEGSSVINVDSTVGFPDSGELYVEYFDNTVGVVSYTSKSLTQFFGCTNILKRIEDSASVGINTYAYSYDPNGSIVRLRINSIISEITLPEKTRYQSKGDPVKIKTLGSHPKGIKFNNWFFNIPSKYNIEKIEIIDLSDNTYKARTVSSHIFRSGDTATITDNTGKQSKALVIDIISNNEIIIKGQGELSTDNHYTIKRNLLKTQAINFPEILPVNSNIQNVYSDNEKLLVSSPSIPNYKDQSLNVSDSTIVFSGVFEGDSFTITSLTDHNFYTGDMVYYTPEYGTSLEYEDGIPTENKVVLSSLFSEGIYFVKRINSTTISLAKSRSDIFNGIFVSTQSRTTVNNNILQSYSTKNKSLQSQKILREIDIPKNDGKIYNTESGPVGILINGVEILNYKSKEFVHYGKLESIEVTSSGENYDIINPPSLSIIDSVGFGATGHCSVSGSLQEIRIIDPGFDYVDTPSIKITGGNGRNAKAYPNMKTISHESVFNSQDSRSVGIGSTVSTIGFSTYHKFRNFEKVIYSPNGQMSVGGLTTNSSYYISTLDDFTIKIHETLEDSISGINTVVLTSYGVGKHSFRSVNRKKIIGSIVVENSGEGYQNNKKICSSLGISTSQSQINIKNHGFNSGEIIKYSNNDQPVQGLNIDQEYYVTKLDNDSFRLSEIGIGSTSRRYYYESNQYLRLKSTGSGSHIFNYPEISVEVIGNIGVSSVSGEKFRAVIQPIFRGEVTSVQLTENGVGYGSSEIINFKRDPLITLRSGRFAQLNPVISSEGKIIDVLVNNSGSEYNSSPDLVINGEGFGAVLTPVIENGQIISVKVIESGIGYVRGSTSIEVVSSGSLCKLSSKIQTWRVNLFRKHFEKISGDDGILDISPNQDYGLQYFHLYPPRKLRESLQPIDNLGNVIYGKTDLQKINNIEADSTNHSPIIGWAYDGNPIYGPYGYIDREGGIVKQLKSGYVLNLKQDRPPTSSFPNGFFVEDYTYKKTSDPLSLDENNGRFCVTPEYPQGTYAYFTTFNYINVDSSGPFVNYKRPIFPYVIGNTYKSIPNKFNFLESSNQDVIDLNKTDWIRNTAPYNLIGNSVSYDYVTIPNELNQESKIGFSNPGKVDSIGINTGGRGYKVGDTLEFDNEGTKGYNLSAEVQQIGGKPVNYISVASSTIYGAEIYPSTIINGQYVIFSENPHSFENNDTIKITGLSTTSTGIEGSTKIQVIKNRLRISGIGTTLGSVTTGIGSVGVTGIVTYINVSGNLNYPNIRENDVLSIGDEKVKVLNIDNKNSRIRILREYEGTVGASHSSSTIIEENPRKLFVNIGFKTSFNYKINKEIYFNPIDSIGLGTIFGPGIGHTISFSNPGSGSTQIFIPTKSIYLPNHGFETGDEITYYTNGGSPLVVSVTGTGTTTLGDQSKLYTAKISNDLIGISTVPIGIGSTGNFVGIASTNRSSSTLYFTNIGIGSYHSFKTNYSDVVVTGTLERNIVTVSTAQTHGLLNEDIIEMEINPSISTSIAVKYNNYNRKVLINPKDFTSLDVDIEKNSIFIENHGFISGQKVIYNSTSPSGGLVDNEMYYVFVESKDIIKLTTTYTNSLLKKPIVVNITTASSGTISPINPKIVCYKDSTITFDLSDSSLSYVNKSQRYPAFSFDFYHDSNFTKPFYTSGYYNSFEVKNYGIIGISDDARTTIFINDKIPHNLYYKLTPVLDNNIPAEKKEISVDKDVEFNNQLVVQNSIYNGKYSIVSTSSTTFTYTLDKNPERSRYDNDSSEIKYHVNTKNSTGSIEKIKILNKGSNYYSVPSVSNIKSQEGSGAILECISNSIGEVKNVTIDNVGFEFAIDRTIRPGASLPQIIKIGSLYSFEEIGITSAGRGYSSPPKLLVFDGKTRNIVPDVDIRYNIGDTKVSIFKNAFSLNDDRPRILPIQNSNGVGISTIRYDSVTKDVTVTLSVGFSTEDSFPFSVNDKILVENISVGVGSTGVGFNSKDYNYQLFTVKSVTENRGGIGSFSYSLDGLLENNQIPGNYNPVNSVSGRVIPEKFFPIFNPVLKSNNYYINETVVSENSVGTVVGWNSKTGQLRISSKDNFSKNNIVEGLSSKAKGVALDIESPSSFFEVNSNSYVRGGWEIEAGFLNNNLQRVQDSDYYQNFSYSINSEIPIDQWNDVVGTLNHTSGFKKFSDCQVESTIPDYSNNSLNIDLPLESSSIDVIVDLIGYADINCVYDFDLVRENNILLGGEKFSNEVTFKNRVLTDYFESVGNRVLLIDDVSNEFNSNPRSTKFSAVYRFPINEARSQKYLTFIKDKRYGNERQASLLTLVHDNALSYTNEYGRVETDYDQGSFDFVIEGSDGVLLYYPTKYEINDFDVSAVAFNIREGLVGIGSTTLGGCVNIKGNSSLVSVGTTTNIVSTSSTFNSIKVLVEIASPDNEYELTELNVVHDGSNTEFIEYGKIYTSIDGYPGLGTYYPYISGSDLNIDFIPSNNVGTALTITTFEISLAKTVGIGSLDIKYSRIIGSATSISSSPTPVENVVGEYEDDYECGYFIAQVVDTTNNRVQLSELVVIDNADPGSGFTSSFHTEFANIETSVGLGTFGTVRSGTNTQLVFTPNPNIDTTVTVYYSAMRYEDSSKNSELIALENATIRTGFGNYFGTERDIKRTFDLSYNGDPIFKRNFLGNDSLVVDVSGDTISMANHFFVTGEEVTYSYAGAGSTQAIGIGTTYISVGVGTTDKLPSSLYVVKLNESTIKLAKTAEDALKTTPVVLDLTHVGIGTSHTLVSKNQNSKVLVAIDNLIQSPIVSTALTTTLATNLFTTSDLLYFSGITSFFGGDLIRVENEIMRIESVGVGSTNVVRVRRPWLGTVVAGYSTGTVVTKIEGQYNIVGNTINFVESPYGNVPFSSSTNPPDSRDWVGVSTSSKFQGRVFLRSGTPNSSDETYHKNYVFDDISSQFTGSTDTFTLKSNGSDISEIENENAIIMINDIFQGPGLSNDYYLSETSGITSVSFVGLANSVPYDINTSQLPKGGIIVSVGSSQGFAYQPLVSAGGTAIVSGLGTISSISIGNSGSGYRSGSQTVRVGIATTSLGTISIEFIGTATVSNGHIVSVAITNPGSGYNSTNPPYVVFDDPLSYSNIPLIYSSSSVSGIGSNATVDIVVGQGSSVINFELKNYGYGYSEGEILTIGIGGTVGIPTDTTKVYEEFKIFVDRVYTDKFTGWSVGELEVIDDISNLFDGSRVDFPLRVLGNIISIRSAKGSTIRIRDTILVFVNDILQVPGDGYQFEGGSTITFSEPPREGDTAKILFYKGSGSIDVLERNILETVKPGDNLTLSYDPYLNQSPYLQQDPRIVEQILSTEVVNTIPYFGPGITDSSNITRPVVWCRQTEDKIINEKGISKDRILYEASIYPSSYLIKSVGIGSTVVFVDNLRPFFDSQNENDTTLEFQKTITLVSQDISSGAAATAIVSAAGTISSVVITDSGFGYSSEPEVTIAGVGVGASINAIASATISSGSVVSISISNAGLGYTTSNPPQVLIAPPAPVVETNPVRSYSGDSGIIVGFGKTTISSVEKLILDFHIPKDSYLRQTNLVGTAVTLSTIDVGDYFVVYGSNVGASSTVIESRDLNNNVIGIGSEFIDNVYQVDTVSNVEYEVVGVGTTTLRRIYARISGISTFSGIVTTSYNFGSFSWGKINLRSRSTNSTFNFYGNNGVTGISTSSVAKRFAPLKYNNYQI